MSEGNTLDDRETHSPGTLDRDSRDFDRPETPPTPRSGCGKFMMGCGCALAGLLVIAIGIGVWVAFNWKGWAADASKAVTAQVVAQSSLSPEDKARIIKRIDQLADDFKSGKLSSEQAKKVLEQIGQSPLFPIAMVMAAEDKYVKPSGLSEDDKAAARLTLQRLARGAFEKKIPEADLQEVMQLLMQKQADGRQQLKQTLTDAELTAFLEKAEEKADAATVPDEPFEVNIADELEKAIDRALKP